MDLPRTLAVIQSGLDAGHHIGAQLYLWRDGRTLADMGIGLARPARGDQPALEMAADTLTLWLSAGKPLTAAAIAQLWEQGKLDLDDPVARFIPQYDQHGKGQITLRHILTHTAPQRLVDIGWPAMPWDQIIDRICAARPEPRWILGRTAGYSAHVTWYLLGEIVRRISGSPIDPYLRRYVAGPCGMDNTSLSMTGEEFAANQHRLAIMQDTLNKRDLGYDTAQTVAAPRPSGSARGPIRELGLFYQALLHRGVGGSGTRLLSPPTIEAMTSRHRANTPDKTFGAIIDWGLGFMINSSIYGNPDAAYQYGPHASPRTFGHSGNQSSAAFADPENDLVCALVFNGLPGEVIHQPRIRSALTAIYEDLGLTA